MLGVFTETDPPRQFWFLAFFRGRPQQGKQAVAKSIAMPIARCRTTKIVDSLDINPTDNYSRQHVANYRTTPLEQGSTWFEGLDKIDAETVGMKD